MPELPEVEHLRRTLEPHLIGARVVSVKLRRAEVVHLPGSRKPRRAVQPSELLAGATITQLLRHGKNLAIVAQGRGRSATPATPVLGVHLGMSGRMGIVAADARFRRNEHAHCIWHIDRSRPSLQSTIQLPGDHFQLAFCDPRRFGGLTVFDSVDSLRSSAWSHLGPDALAIDGDTLQQRLSESNRAVKVALLDQSVLAGVGNIYADESLFAARIHPTTVCSALSITQITALAHAIVKILQHAVHAGGSTIRDYVDGNGNAGLFRHAHLVYARQGQPCVNCGQTLHGFKLAQRTTVACWHCQPIERRGHAKRPSVRSGYPQSTHTARIDRSLRMGMTSQ